MAVILDTSLLIAFYDLDDGMHQKAHEIVRELETGKFGKLVISDYVFDETVTLLKKYLGNGRATAIGDYLLKSLELAEVDTEVFSLAWKLSKKFDKLSFTDCSIIALMKHYGIEYAATFDSGFSGIVKTL